MDYVLISKLQLDAETSRIKVRVCRKWDVYNIQGRFMSTDFVFVDEEANYIHAFVRANTSRRLNDKLKEGCIYFIKNFSVIPNRKKFRVIVKNELMLTLDGNTVVKIVDQDIQNIPRHVFEFVDLEKLEPNADEHFVDAIGVITTAGKVEEKNVNGSGAKLLNLELCKITNSNNFNDIVGEQCEFTVDFSGTPDTKKIALSEILQLGKENCDEDTMYIVSAKVIDVRNKGTWYYVSCGDKCKKGLSKIDDGYWCDNCRRVVKFPLPRKVYLC